MSMEQELARIADALEKLVEAKTKSADQLVEKVMGEAPAPKKTKSTKAVKAVTPEQNEVANEDTWFDAETETPVAEEPAMTVDELLKYCNGKLAELKTAEERKAKVQAIIAHFTKTFGVNNVKSVPVDKTGEAKKAFDKIMGV